MFADDDFIQASRKFVCVRIETYESKESEKMVRSLLNGRFANTAFCIFDPQGKERLTRAGRGPGQILNFRSNGNETAAIVRQMNRIASQYKPKSNSQKNVLQDFDSFRQALNVASADQRLLIVVNSNVESKAAAVKSLRSVLSDESVVGKFHSDVIGETDKNWNRSIKGSVKANSITVIQSGQFGLDGKVVASLPASSSPEKIKSALLAANKKFSASEERKDYSDHVREGRRKRIYFENEIPYGEDRDGDGKADNQRRRKGR